MATLYFWDIGFDWNTVLNRNQEYFLQNGFVLMNTPVTVNGQQTTANVPATPVNISKGDSIGFNVFNVTTNPPAGDFSIVATDSAITFSNAVAQFDGNNQLITSPFSNSDGSYMTTLVLSPVAPVGNGPSVAFSPIQVPNALALEQPTVQFPVYFCGIQQVANNGRFLMSVQLTIQAPDNSQRTFYVDPEMIVGGTN